MRQIKVVYKEALIDGLQPMVDEVNEALKEIDEMKGTVKNITYNSSDTFGRINSAIIEYDI